MTPTQSRTRPARRVRSAPSARAADRRAATRGRPPMDPRIRQRRAAVTRREGRRRLRMIVLAMAAIGLGVGAWMLLHSSLMSARVITVSGSTHTPAAEIEAAGGLGDRPPLISIDPGAVASRIERLPWVATAVVTRHWPDGVHVTVVERVPVAAMTEAHGDALVDVHGRVLADVATPPPGLPTLVAPVAVPAPGSSLAPPALPALEVAAALPPAFRAQVQKVVLDRAGLHLDLTSPITVTLGSTSQLRQKWEDVASILKGASLHPGDVIDVTAPGSPIVTGP
jgi:cell division protein FtsQ